MLTFDLQEAGARVTKPVSVIPFPLMVVAKHDVDVTAAAAGTAAPTLEATATTATPRATILRRAETRLRA